MMPDLRQIQDHRFRSAKRWFGGSLVTRAAALGAGLTSLEPAWAPITPYLVASLSVIGELTSWRSEAAKSAAERVLRLLERVDGMGATIEREEWADLGIIVPKIEGQPAPYFSASELPGPRRVLENTRESAWWTRHLATTMAGLLTATIVAAVVISIVVLLSAMNVVAEHGARVVAARAATVVLVAVVSLGLVKLAYSYRVLARRAEMVGAQARERLSRETSELAALSVLHDYQIARTAGPVIPQFVYEAKKPSLERAWAAAKARG